MAKKKIVRPGPDRKTQEDEVKIQEAREYKFWFDELKRAKNAHNEYFDRGKKIIKLYKDVRAQTSEGASARHRMNILWSNVGVLQPALYSSTPAPNVARRFLDKDPVSRMAATIIERNLSTAIELFDFDYPMQRVRDDYLICGRGITWVRFAPEMGMVPQKEPVREVQHADGKVFYRAISDDTVVDEAKVKDDEDIGKYYETEPVESVLSYGLDVDHVMWDHFLHEPVGDWSKCGWVARKTLMKKQELKNLSPKGAKVRLNKHFEANDDKERNSEANCAEVWEIWHKASKMVIWITDGLPEQLLKVEEDPLRLSTFFPCPRPLLATTTTDSMIPVPDYVLYQDQADQIDIMTDRIRILTKACRVVGVFNSANESLQQMLEEGNENDMIPVDNWVWFQGSGGIKGNVDWFPLEQVITVLKELFSARQQMRQDLYEITGISDIVRGATMASETATAQQIKSNFSNLRLQARQAEMSRLARDTLRKMAEIQCEHYPDEVLIEMSGILESDDFKTQDPAKQQIEAQKLAMALQLIKTDRLRTFKIDIETDSTVAADQENEKKTRVEFLTAVAPFIEKAAQVGQIAPQMTPLLLKMLDFGVRGFRAGRTLETAISEVIDTVDKMTAQAAAQPQEAPKDPEAEAKAQELQAKVAKLQQELQTAQAEQAAAQTEMQAKMADMAEKRAREKEQYDKAMLKLNEEIEFRRIENERKLIDANLAIELKQLQIAELKRKSEQDEIKAALGESKPAEQLEADGMNYKAALAKAQADLAEQQVRYAELQQKQQKLGGLSELSGQLGTEAYPADLGSPLFSKPKAKKPNKKVIGFIKDPETGSIQGATVDEIEVGDDDEEVAV